jgi:hypothetical protein
MPVLNIIESKAMRPFVNLSGLPKRWGRANQFAYHSGKIPKKVGLDAPPCPRDYNASKYSEEKERTNSVRQP